jgi:hypothetical protein
VDGGDGHGAAGVRRESARAAERRTRIRRISSPSELDN